MAAKTLTVTEEAYERLKAHKRPGESFTDVVLRLAGDERDVTKGFGAWADEDIDAAVEETREELNADLAARQDELFGQ